MKIVICGKTLDCTLEVLDPPDITLWDISNYKNKTHKYVIVKTGPARIGLYGILNAGHATIVFTHKIIETNVLGGGQLYYRPYHHKTEAGVVHIAGTSGSYGPVPPILTGLCVQAKFPYIELSFESSFQVRIESGSKGKKAVLDEREGYYKNRELIKFLCEKKIFGY